eukprot:TRINITY_DN1487_c0_g1_i1.p1 TRINITY_DN1487_c0_g1~~TRINITY_DN1487_c0_g1_i1.p1  ORF type:complete len:377 (-),score=128.74 TRINITY_DN1487_c0_g1_i1:40-1170(-)
MSVASLWAKTKTKAVQTKQMVNVKLGRAEETVDNTFEEERAKFNDHYTKLKKLREDGRRVVKALTELSAAQMALFEDFLTLYPQDATAHANVTKGREASSSAEAARMVFEQNMTKDFIDPLTVYNGQFEELKKRMDVRSTRKIDMDRYKFDLKNHQAKNNPKAGVTEEKFQKAAHSYDLLNTELRNDMPALYEDRGSFLEPLYSVYTKSLYQYYEASQISMQMASQMVREVSPGSLSSKLRVITPDANSWAYQGGTGNERGSGPDHPSATGSESGYSPSNNYAPSSPPPNESVLPPSHMTGTVMGVPPPATTYEPALPSNAGKPGKVLFNFTGQDETELTVTEGDRILIYAMEGEWWEAEFNGRRGLLPFNYVALE